MSNKVKFHRHRTLVGERFGRLVVISQTESPPKYKKQMRYWRCQCDCGNEAVVSTSSLGAGNTQSCGCLQKERAAEFARDAFSIHGLSKTREYNIWANIIGRCTNPTDPAWDYYGGRGIVICDRWRKSFENFLEDVGPSPSKRHSIDRIDGAGNYEPKNVRWATPKQQSRNRPNVRKITYRGRTQPLSAWSEELGINLGTLYSRLYRNHWPVEKAFTTDPNTYHNKSPKTSESRS